MSVRQVFYQLVARGVIEKTEEGTVIRLLTDTRLDGTIPFDLIVDETRRARITQTFDSERLDCDPPIVERAALTETQITQHALPTRATKRRGNSHAHNFVGDSVELDALPPSDLRAMVRAVIEQHVWPEATEALCVAEDSECELLRAWRA